MLKLSDKQLSDWLDQVADGLDSGMEASGALALAKQLPGGRSGALVQILREGAGWSAVFSEGMLSLNHAEQVILTAAEKAARIPQAMRSIAESRRVLRKTKRKIALALAYPLFLLHFAALIFPIQYLVDGDDRAFLVSVGMVVVPVWLLVGFFWALGKGLPSVLLGIARSVPLLRSYRMHWESGVLCDVLANCFASGMAVDVAWDVAVSASGNPKHLKLGGKVQTVVQRGGKVSEAIEASASGLPSGFAEMYRSGEASGRLDQNLAAAAVRFRQDASNRLTLASMLYPKVILVGVFGYVGYKIIKLVGGYFDRLAEINM